MILTTYVLELCNLKATESYRKMFPVAELIPKNAVATEYATGAYTILPLRSGSKHVVVVTDVPLTSISRTVPWYGSLVNWGGL